MKNQEFGSARNFNAGRNLSDIQTLSSRIGLQNSRSQQNLRESNSSARYFFKREAVPTYRKSSHPSLQTNKVMKNSLEPYHAKKSKERQMVEQIVYNQPVHSQRTERSEKAKQTLQNIMGKSIFKPNYNRHEVIH